MKSSSGSVNREKVMKHQCSVRRGKGRQRGATLLEAVAFLGIAAIILIGAIALFTNAFQGARSNQLTEEVAAIQSGVRKIYATPGGLQTNVTGGGVAGLIQAGVIPATLSISGTTVTDEWGGTVALGWDATTSAAIISFPAVPQAVCMAALTAGGNWSGISTSVKTAVQPVPVSAADAELACNATNVTINWEFTS